MKKAFAVFALVLATSSLAFAGGRGQQHQGARLGEKLNLTGAQKEQMKAIRLRSREANKQLATDLRTKRRELAQLRRAGDPRAEGVKVELQTMHQQLRATKMAAHQQMLGVLTTEQRQQLDQLRAERQRNRE